MTVATENLSPTTTTRPHGAHTSTPARDGWSAREARDVRIDERTGLAYVNDPYGRPLQVVWEQWERIGDEKDLHITEHFDPRDFEVPGTRAHAALEYANRRIADMPRPATDPPTAALVLARKGSVPEALVESARAILDPELAEDILTTVYDYAAHPASERIVLNELRYRLEPLLAIGAGGLHREALSQLREHGRLDRGLYEKLHETYAWASHIAPVVKSQSADPDPEGLIRAHGLPEDSPDVKRLRLHSDTLYSLERMMDELEGLLDDEDSPAPDHLVRDLCDRGVVAYEGMSAIEASNQLAEQIQGVRSDIEQVIIGLLAP